MKKAIIFIMALCLVWYFFGGGKEEAEREEMSEGTQNTVASVAETPKAPEVQLSEEARNIELRYFHGAYTDMGTVDIHAFRERDELLENMVNLIKKFQVEKESAVPVKYKREILADNYYCITDEETNLQYLGKTKNDRPNGFGILLEAADGKVDYDFKGEIGFRYVGNFKDGCPDGYGALFFLGDYSIGSAVQAVAETGLLNDAQGEMLVEYLWNHVSYEGYFDKGKKDGKGNLFEFPHYEGELFLFGEIRPAPDGYIWGLAYQDVIKGEFKNDKINGTVKKYGNGLKYDGEMEDGEYQGKGTSYYSNGQIEYTGEWKKGRRHGKGAQYNMDGSVDYEGEWKNDTSAR